MISLAVLALNACILKSKFYPVIKCICGMSDSVLFVCVCVCVCVGGGDATIWFSLYLVLTI